MWEKLVAAVKGYNHRFGESQDPFQIMTRLVEECGELAQQVNNFEGMGVKRQKMGEPDRGDLSAEIVQVMGTAMALGVYYGVEPEMRAYIDLTYQRLKSEGHIQD